MSDFAINLDVLYVMKCVEVARKFNEIAKTRKRSIERAELTIVFLYSGQGHAVTVRFTGGLCNRNLYLNKKETLKEGNP